MNVFEDLLRERLQPSYAYEGVRIHRSPLLKPDQIIQSGRDLFVGDLAMVDIRFMVLRSQLAVEIKRMFNEERRRLGLPWTQ